MPGLALSVDDIDSRCDVHFWLSTSPWRSFNMIALRATALADLRNGRSFRCRAGLDSKSDARAWRSAVAAPCAELPYDWQSLLAVQFHGPLFVVDGNRRLWALRQADIRLGVAAFQIHVNVMQIEGLNQEDSANRPTGERPHSNMS